MNKEKIINSIKFFFKSFLWVIPVLLVLDIVSKQVAQANLSTGKMVTFIPHLIGFELTYNDGAAFSLFGNLPEVPRRILLISFSTIGAIVMIVVLAMKYKKLNWWYKSSLYLMLAGCVGNFIDRVFYEKGLVIDFIRFIFWEKFAIFNLADVFLVVGAFLLIIAVVIEEIQDNFKMKKIDKDIEESKDDEKADR
ncbi:MAG: signal peptidase II [Bacilli bacterium]|nr:signal peptidase II [Bacilli bacterium]MDY5248676.1 signal peptidase II [Bacilli bacterium]MDY5744937.1 signal peptidase II [Bacilli bacterium]MDY6009306.1 signal peptidase II [Bacilli bacterium]